MNILVIAAGYGLFRPKSGSRNRFYNLITELIRRENMGKNGGKKVEGYSWEKIAEETEKVYLSLIE